MNGQCGVAGGDGRLYFGGGDGLDHVGLMGIGVGREKVGGCRGSG